ncbi:MAG: dTDP-4-dehydrorhamnose reductase [candidate division Zixibacteria bacterium]|nr:dTDP-4-dehydrorhamnose reductase [candidate division Zixibacteria bacterium]
MANSNRIVITGANGQLGSDLNARYKGGSDVIGLTRHTMDITNRQRVREQILRLEPRIVLHAAAFTDVDACQGDESTAMRVNAEGTDNVASACSDAGARMVFYSTDYVFDGTKTSAYIETDAPNPQTVYGRSKLAGEQAVTAALSNHLIMRVAWVYGEHGKNFVKTIIQRAMTNVGGTSAGIILPPLQIVDDQIGNPTWTVDIVRQTETAAESDLTGVVHCTSEGEVSWYRFACEIFSMLELNVEAIPCRTEDYPRPAPRPRRSALENARLKEAGLNVMRPYRVALAEFIKQNGGVLRQFTVQ